MRSELERAKDIIKAAREVHTFTHGAHVSRLIKDRKTWLAVVKLMENIGEAIKHLSPAFRYAHAKIDWSLFVGSRDWTAHHYWDVNPNLLRDKIKEVRRLGNALERSPLLRGWDSKTSPKTAQDPDREIALFMQKPRHAKYRAKREKLVKRKIIKRKAWY